MLVTSLVLSAILQYNPGTERKILDGQAINAPLTTYSYAPTFVWTGNRLLSWSCVTAANGAGDAVALTYSDDQVNWSHPTIIFQERVNNANYHPFACDPAVVIVQPPGEAQTYYYLYYGGAQHQGGGFIAVARSPVEHPAAFKKWIGGDPRAASSWRSEVNVAPAFIAAPQRPCASGGGASCYGAGQPTVVYRNGEFLMWYTDTTAIPQQAILLKRSNDGVHFGPAVATNIPAHEAASVEVKFDPATSQYMMFLLAGHSATPTLTVRTSADGVSWSAAQTFGNPPAWSHNLGVTGNPHGYLERHKPFYVGYGAPYDLAPNDSWGRWDLYMGRATFTGGTPPPPPPPPPPPTSTVDVHRYFSGQHHFYTTNKAEGDRTGWRYEGVAFKAGAQQLANSKELMRCRLHGNGLHFLSSARDCEGQIVEGPIGWLLWSPAAGSQEVLRCFKGTHFLTTANRQECVAAGFTIQGALGYTPGS